MKGMPFSSEVEQQGWILQKTGCVEPVLFSEGTYQVGVKEGSEIYWPFLQITDRGELKDYFCSCSLSPQEGSLCLHGAAAWLVIFGKEMIPLHVRFRESLWNQLGRMAALRHGYDTQVLVSDLKAGFEIKDDHGRRLFHLKPKTSLGKEWVKRILLERKTETEETSLKFSNLSQEEWNLWREGRPSFFLNYELSFWSDLAKWWMILQNEERAYTLYFGKETPLPSEIGVQFEDVEFSFYISKASWPDLIPSLTTVDSPLKTHRFSPTNIKSMRFDFPEKTLHLDIELDGDRMINLKGYLVGEWIFIANNGFYPSQSDPLLKKKTVSGLQLVEFLDKHHLLVAKFLVGPPLHLTSIPASYLLSFDSNFSLILVCYAFDPGDLESPDVACFMPWVYFKDRGFYKLDLLLFNQVQTIIPKEEVSTFVTRHRHWLNAFEGFQTHIISEESKLSYLVDEKGLSFQARSVIAEEEEQSFEFENWVYVKGRGFYSKPKFSGAFFFQRSVVPPDEISSFIDKYREELENIPYFFSSKSPIERVGLNIYLNEEKQIVIEPKYDFLPSYRADQTVIFDNYVYVETEGFSRVPSLPEIGYSNVTVIDREQIPYFMGSDIRRLIPYVREMDSRLKTPQSLPLKITSLKKDQKGNWFIGLEYESDLGRVLVREVWEELHRGETYLFCEAGALFLKQARYSWLKVVSKAAWADDKKTLKMNTLEWIRLFVLEQFIPPNDPVERQVWDEFNTFETSLSFSLEGFKSELRHYQKQGMKWLWFLYCNGLSGLLCDEMGLGKTHQAMALMAAVYNKQLKGPFLVVCPTTVIFHWEALLKRYLPNLTVVVYHGSYRTFREDRYDLLLTSYGIIRSDKKSFGERLFTVAIFDEIQAAKNMNSQIHRALKTIQALFRVGLTGTPIENSLLDLKALFDLVLPGYLPTNTLYKQLFVHPIEKQGDHNRKDLLARLIRPFILRRKKSEVLLELPPKVETIAYAFMSEEQWLLYKQVYRLHRQKLKEELSDYSKNIPYLHVFSLLVKLKQICNHPALFKNRIEEYEEHKSGKWDLFVALMEQIQESGDKVVVFSQYLGMLDIIERYLDKKGIQFARIRGSTLDRQAEVAKFREQPACKVFVGSLQAAGVGIDLIAASVVIHYDRWWNFAREEQATDRVHRIGQNRGVQVFKIVAKGTIEEHIHRLIEKKTLLATDLIGSDEQSQIKVFTREELVELFSMIDQNLKQL